eukprot:5531245-Lingulodinium_polyedra.AAC.1
MPMSSFWHGAGPCVNHSTIKCLAAWCDCIARMAFLSSSLTCSFGSSTISRAAGESVSAYSCLRAR